MLRTFAPLLLAGSAFAQYSSNVSTSDCPTGNGVHIIVARASDEAEGYGITGIVKDQVLARVPGSTAEFVVYPATLDDYQNSETSGVVAMKELVNAYVAKCTQPFVLMGYSQGAQVTLDTIVGQEDQGFTDNSTVDQPLSDSTLSRLRAVVVFGDPTFVTTETFHVGNATQNGDFPREDVSRFTPALSAKIQSYCDANDLFCAGGTSLIVHASYIQEYGVAAENFVVGKVGGNSTASATGALSTRPASSSRAASSRAASSKTASSKVASSRVASASACRASASRVSASKSKATASKSLSSSGSATKNPVLASASSSKTGSTTTATSTATSTIVLSTGAASALQVDVIGLGAMLVLAMFL